jgi:hypothetical protein
MNNQQKAIAIALYRRGSSPQNIATFLGVTLSVLQSFLQFNAKNSDGSPLGIGFGYFMPAVASTTSVQTDILGKVLSISGVGTSATVTVQPVDGSSANPVGSPIIAQANDMYTEVANPTQSATDASGSNFGVGAKVIVSGTTTSQSGNLFTVALMTSSLSVVVNGLAITLITTTMGGGGGSSSVFVNGTSVTNPDFNNSVPAAPAGYINVIWQVFGSEVAAYVPIGGGTGTVTSVGTSGIATGGPITSTGTINVLGSGNTLTSATAAANLGAAPSGDVLTADGAGNVQDSGILLSALALQSALPATFAASTNEFLTSYTAATGLFTAAQPSAANLSNGTTGTGAVVLASAIAGFGSGTVTSVAAGTGITASPSPITTAGTISITNTAVTPGSYTYTSITVNAQGQLTAASSGAAPTGTVTSVSFTGGLISVATPTTTPALTVAGTAGGFPYFSSSSTWSSTAALTGIVRGNGSTFSASEISGDATTSGSNALTLATVNSNVGSFTYASITVNAKGLITAAASGAAPTGTVSSVSLGAPTGFTITGSPVTGSGTLAFVMPTGWATGALLLGSGAASVASLGIGSTGNVLTVSGGTAIWAAPATSGTVTTVGFTGGLISVANQTTTPALTVAGTSGGIVYFSSASTWASSAVLPAGDFVLGGGAGAAPTATFSIVPIANGGTGTGSTLVGLVRGSASAFTAAEISGDATTSGSNALTLATVNSNVGSFTYASITVNAKGLITAAASGAAPTGTVTTVGFTGGLISVATATTTPALTVAGTSGGIVYFSSASTWASSALLAAGGVVLGGGAGTAPATNTQLVFGTSTLTIGLAGAGTGILALKGTTSGIVSITGQAAAGTYNFNLPITVGSAGQVLTSQAGGATAMTWTTPTTGTVTSVSFTGGLISVATATTTPAFTVAGTSGGIPYFSSASTWASSAALPLNNVVLGGGTGGSPTASALLSFTPATGLLSVGGGGASGEITLLGSSSGQLYIQAPAAASTATNPMTISNSLQLPSGTVYSIGGDTGLSRSSAGVFLVGNGTAGDSSGAIIATTLKLPSGQLSVGVISAAMAGGSGAVGDLSVARSADTGAIFFGSSATIAAGAGSFWYWDGTYMNLGPGAQLSCAGGPGVTAGPFTAVTGIRTYGGIVIALSGTSDERLKDAELYEGGLGAILAISPVRYRWNAKGQAQTGLSGDQEFVGFIAQDVQRAIPEAITATEPSKDGTETYLSLDDRPIICALVNAVKELKAEIEELKRRH